MEEAQRIRMLQCPEYPVDVVIDTDTYNEVDDQFALAYLLRNSDKLRLQAIYAAPFLNEKADTPKDGMEKSYQEILRILNLADAGQYKASVFRGGEHFLEDENTPVVSPASEDLIERAMLHSQENPLYVIGIAAATNIASAILLEPAIKERIVVVWLGGSAFHCEGMDEFNLMEDLPAARVLFDCGVPLVQLPCWGVVESFTLSRPELEVYFLEKNKLADYLARYTIEAAEEWASGTAWAKVIWDVTAVAWLLNDGQRFMKDRIVSCPEIVSASRYTLTDGVRPSRRGMSYGMPSGYTLSHEVRSPKDIQYIQYGMSFGYVFSKERHSMKYVYRIERDALMTDLIRKLCT